MITHAPRGDIINIYTSMPWANLCAEVAKLQITLPQPAEVIPFRRAVNDGGSAIIDVLESADRSAFTSQLTSVPSLAAKPATSFSNSEWKLVEAPGVESASLARSPAISQAASGPSRPFVPFLTPRGRKADENPTPLPTLKPDAVDLARAADAAILAGHVHLARRLLVQLVEELLGGERNRLPAVRTR